MPDSSLDGTRRLRAAGVGSAIAGGLLILCSPFVSFSTAAVVVLVCGFGSWLSERTLTHGRRSIGILAVGSIAVLEATAVSGLGLTAGSLGVIALALGVGDILVGKVLGRFRR